MNDLFKWALGIMFSLILGAYAYANRVDNLSEVRTERAEVRVVERLDRVENKLDRLLERR